MVNKEEAIKSVDTFDLLREFGAMDYKSLLSPLNLLFRGRSKVFTLVSISYKIKSS